MIFRHLRAPALPSCLARRGAWWRAVARSPRKPPVAITYNRVTHAVMMATPADFHDFARGFTLNERIVADAREIEEIEIVAAPRGAVELRLWIAPTRMEALDHRRRNLSGAMGCGLCGLDSLEEATRQPPPVPRRPSRFRPRPSPSPARRWWQANP